MSGTSAVDKKVDDDDETITEAGRSRKRTINNLNDSGSKQRKSNKAKFVKDVVVKENSDEEELDLESVGDVDDDDDDDEPFGTGCLVCGSGKDENKILLCETCDGEYHIYCLNPPLPKVPKDDWYCPTCIIVGLAPSSTSTVVAAAVIQKDKSIEPDKSLLPSSTTSSSAEDDDDDDALLLQSLKRDTSSSKLPLSSLSSSVSNMKPSTTTGKHVPTCTITTSDIMQYDGMEELVAGLPPEYTSRFGEIAWAQGGTGYGWWPSIICDPRSSLEPIRSLARKFLGKKHLVYFFRCGLDTSTNNSNYLESQKLSTAINVGDNTKKSNTASNTNGNPTANTNTSISNNKANNTINENNPVNTIISPFALLKNKQIKTWYDGLAEELYMGRAAKNCGRCKYALFQEAMAQATLEIGKTLDERLDWGNLSSSSYFGPPESSSPGAGCPIPTKQSTALATDTSVSQSAISSPSIPPTPSKRRLLDTVSGGSALASLSQLDDSLHLSVHSKTNMSSKAIVSSASSVLTSSKKQKKKSNKDISKLSKIVDKEHKATGSGSLIQKVAQRVPLDQLLVRMIDSAKAKIK